MSTMKKEYRFIDLFAGIGGFHIALHENGGKCVFASEIDKFARQTYEHNFKKISPDIFKNGNFNQDITDPNLDYSEIPDFDILCAGFPCQPFSHAGLKKGFDDTRGTLFFNIKEIIKTKIKANELNNKTTIPKIILLENVKGFKNHDKGNTFRVVKRTLNELGYEVAAEVLNSKHFGIPQNRERIFIVAWYKNDIKETHFNFPFGINANNEVIFEKEKRDKESCKICVGDILLKDRELELLENKENKTYTISEKLWAGHKRRRIEHAKKGNGFGYSMFNLQSPYTSTISARYFKDGSEILIEQSQSQNRPSRPRKLHPFEAARLQGFPIDSWYQIPVSDNQAYKQFGNSISVPVVKYLVKEIIRQLLSK
jgi:DNA (cytosine-5)-methyltransferase 1